MGENADRERSLLRAIIDGATDAIFIKDTDGRYVFINASGAHLLGKRTDEVVGQVDEALFEPDAVQSIRDRDRRVMVSREAEVYEATSTAMGITRTYFTVKYPWRDKDGTVLGIVGIARDVTERRVQEQALATSEARYRALFEAASDAILIVQDDRVGEANSRAVELFGLTADELRGHTLEDLFTLREVAGGMSEGPPFPQRLHEALAGRPQEFPWQIWGSGRRPLVVEVKLQQVDVGEHSFLQVVIRDLSERDDLEAQLRQAQKLEAVGLLAGGVAHDFNNLLTAVNANAESLLESFASDDPRRVEAAEVVEAGDRAAWLTRQLLAFSRRQGLQPVVLEPNAVIRDSVKLLRRVIGEDIELATVLDPDVLPIEADRGQIQQVMMNLAVNARDAMPQGGRLELRTQNAPAGGPTEAPRVKVSVSDTGEGMSPEVVDRIFEPFFTTKERDRGTGLGLSTVYGIVKQNGGDISVHSVPGRGTTFQMTFPAHVGEQVPAASAKREGPPGGTETVLLVEDEPMVRGAMARSLRRLGYTVVVASGGEDALVRCDQFSGPIHALVTDVVMPRMNGREVADRVRARRPDIRVLYVTGYTDDEVLRRGLFSEGEILLEKPVSRDTLARRLRELLEAQDG